MRHFFIINPHSFSTPDEHKKVADDITHYFQKSGGTFRIHISRYPRDAIAVIQRYVVQVPSSETIRIYAVGGDGILFDCLNGIVGIKNIELTCMPFGKTNSFIRVFGPEARKHFLDIPALVKGVPHPMDIINCGTNYALSFAVMGFEALTVYKANKFMRHLNKKFAKRFSARIYTVFAGIAIANNAIRRQWYRINIDGDDVSDKYFHINVTNNPCSSERNIPSPNAMPDDGLLNMLFAKSSDRLLKLLKAILVYNRGKELNRDFFFEKKVQVVKVTSDSPIHVHLDGEYFQTYALKLEIIKHGIQFVAPEGMGIYDYSGGGRGF